MSRGPAEARNRAAQSMTDSNDEDDVLLFVDADVVIHRDAVQRVRETFAADPSLAALFGSYDDTPPHRTIPSLYKNLLHHWVHQHAVRDAWTFWAGCGAIRRDAFLAVGGFDAARYPRPSIEDIELGARLRRAGYRIAVVPEVQATHHKRWTMSSLLRTDIRSRAIPWTLLLLEQGGTLPGDLNLDWRSRIGAVAAFGAVVSPFLTIWLAPAILLGIPIGVLCIVLLHHDLFAFFHRRGGAAFVMGAALLHTLYLLYSAVTFAVVTVLFRLGALHPMTPCRALPSATKGSEPG
jgi:GT2 family glycosyltransferase